MWPFCCSGRSRPQIGPYTISVLLQKSANMGSNPFSTGFTYQTVNSFMGFGRTPINGFNLSSRIIRSPSKSITDPALAPKLKASQHSE